MPVAVSILQRAPLLVCLSVASLCKGLSPLAVPLSVLQRDMVIHHASCNSGWTVWEMFSAEQRVFICKLAGVSWNKCHPESYRKYRASRLPHKRKTYNIEEKLKQQVQYWTKTEFWFSDKSQKILLLYGCRLKEEALDRTMWRRNRFGRGFGPGVWQITDDDDGCS